MTETLVEKLSAGLTRTLAPQPCALVIFGGSGDLSRRKLLPGLYNLAVDGLLPGRFATNGFSKNAMTDEAFRTVAHEGTTKFSRREVDEQAWTTFSRCLFYQPGSFDDAAAYAALKERLQAVDSQFGIPGNHIFYLA